MVVAALALLLLAGVDLLGLDLWFPAACSESGTTSSGLASQDECYCCSTHTLITQAVTFERHDVVEVATPQEYVPFISVEGSTIYHPPRV